MSHLVEHARDELRLLGEDDSLSANLVTCVAAFYAFDHSGESAAVARDHLARLLAGENLSPLTSNPAEWEDRTEINGTPLWQNRRNSVVFSVDAGKTWYHLDEQNKDVSDFTPPDWMGPFMDMLGGCDEVVRLMSGRRATVQVNAPLALTQQGMEAEVSLLTRLYHSGLLVDPTTPKTAGT